MVFKALIKAEFSFPPADVAEHPNRPLSFEERNVLRFVAGYIMCHKVYTELDASSIPEKEEMFMY